MRKESLIINLDILFIVQGDYGLNDARCLTFKTKSLHGPLRENPASSANVGTKYGRQRKE